MRSPIRSLRYLSPGQSCSAWDNRPLVIGWKATPNEVGQVDVIRGTVTYSEEEVADLTTLDRESGWRADRCLS